MENTNLGKRKELALKLLYELKSVYTDMENTASEVENSSNQYYEEAYNEKQGELSSMLGNYHCNVERAKEINNEITASINSWYDFIKDEKKTGKLTFPVSYILKKRYLNKIITKLNKEISSLTINNRFIKENLNMLSQQLEVKAICIAMSGGNYKEFESILLKHKTITDELRYLLPTIQGLCPADITSSGIEAMIVKLEEA